MPAAKPTAPQIARAIEAARRTGCEVVKVEGGAIYILVSQTAEDITSPREEPNPWDQATGTA